LTTDIK